MSNMEYVCGDKEDEERESRMSKAIIGQTNSIKHLEKMTGKFATPEMNHDYMAFLEKDVRKSKAENIFLANENEQLISMIQELKDEIIKIKSKR